MNSRRLFRAGEKSCAVCNDPLPAFESNSQRGYACTKTECRRTVYANLIQKTREIKEGEVICSLDGCTRPVAPGTYQLRRTRFFCCASHERKFYGRTEVGKCLCCGEPIMDFPFKMGRRQYLNKAHRLHHLSQLRVPEIAGPFAEVLDSYLTGEAKLCYAKTSFRAARNYLTSFFGWLRSVGVVELDGITSDVITAYMVRERERGVKTDNYITYLSTFFGWARLRHRMTIPSPIIHKFHKVRHSQALHRDYSRPQIEHLWRALEARGTCLMKAVVAIGLEAGCRISEIGGLRLSDVDFSRQTLFIEKSKNGTQRFTHFGDKTTKYLKQWLEERDPHCGHDRVFYTSTLAPINFSGYLQSLIKNAVCKSKDFPEGVESFHSHSCRHSWASLCADNGLDPICIMALGGWKTWSSMQRYVRTSKERIETQYHEAAVRGAEERRLGPETVVSLADLVAQEHEKGVSRNCR